MKRTIQSILCFLEYHKWYTNLPWHGAFAKAWKRCKHCGKEAPSSMPITEYSEIIRKYTEE